MHLFFISMHKLFWFCCIHIIFTIFNLTKIQLAMKFETKKTRRESVFLSLVTTILNDSWNHFERRKKRFTLFYD